MTKGRRWWRRSVPWWARQRSPASQTLEAVYGALAEGGRAADGGPDSPPLGVASSLPGSTGGRRSASASPGRDEVSLIPNINFSFFGNSREDLGATHPQPEGNPRAAAATFKTSVSLEVGGTAPPTNCTPEKKIPEYAKVVKNSKSGTSLVEAPRARSQTLPSSAENTRDGQRYSNCFPSYEEVGSLRQIDKALDADDAHAKVTLSSQTLPDTASPPGRSASSLENRDITLRYSNCGDTALADKGYDKDDGPDYEELKVSPTPPESHKAGDSASVSDTHYERLVERTAKFGDSAQAHDTKPPDVPLRLQSLNENSQRGSAGSVDKHPAADKVTAFSSWTLRCGSSMLHKLRKPMKVNSKAASSDGSGPNGSEQTSVEETPSVYEIPPSHSRLVVTHMNLSAGAQTSPSYDDNSGLKQNSVNHTVGETAQGVCHLYGNADNAANYSKEMDDGSAEHKSTPCEGTDTQPRSLGVRGGYTNITEDFVNQVKLARETKTGAAVMREGSKLERENVASGDRTVVMRQVGSATEDDGGIPADTSCEVMSVKIAEEMGSKGREWKDSSESVELKTKVESRLVVMVGGGEQKKTELENNQEEENFRESCQKQENVVVDGVRDFMNMEGGCRKVSTENGCQTISIVAECDGKSGGSIGMKSVKVEPKKKCAEHETSADCQTGGKRLKMGDESGNAVRGGSSSREGSTEVDTEAYKSTSRSPDGACCWDDAGDYESLTVTSTGGDYEDLEYCELRVGKRVGGGVGGGRVQRTIRACARWWRSERGRLAAAVERQAAAQAVGVAPGGVEAGRELVRRRRRARLHHSRPTSEAHCCVPEGQSGFEELRRYIKQGGDFCKELSAILQERCEAETAYAKALGKLSGKLSRASRDAAGSVGAAWQAAGLQMQQQAEAHRALAASLGEEVVKPLRQLSDAQHRIRKSVEVAVDKAGRGLSEWRHAQAKSKKASFAAARENERLQDSHLEATPTQLQPLHARLGPQLTDKESAKLQQKRRKAEECVKRADVEYWGCCVRAERARLEWEAAVCRGGRCLQALDEDRLDASSRLARQHLTLLEQLVPRLMQSVARLREPVEACDVQRDLRTTAALKGAGQPLPEQLLPDFYAEHVTLAMNRDRRKQALVKLLQLIRQDLERERRGKQGVEQLARALKASASEAGSGGGGAPGTADADGESVGDKLHHARSMLAYLEAARYKVQGALLELEGRPRVTHPLAPHISVSRDRAGMQHSVLKVPPWVRDESVELISAAAGEWPSTVSVVNGCDDRGAGDGNSVRPADSDFDEFSSQGSDEQDFECGLESGGKATPGGSAGTASRCRALYDYSANLYDELSLAPGDVIRIHSKQADGWWLGELNGVVGIFPATYVEEID